MQDLEHCSGLKHLKSKTCLSVEASKTMVEKVGAPLGQEQAPSSNLACVVEKEVGLAHGVRWQPEGESICCGRTKT